MQSEEQKIGQMGENIAVDYLRKNGYQILARNFKTKWGELDIVASPPHQTKLWCGGKKNDTIVFVEVKTLKFNVPALRQGLRLSPSAVSSGPNCSAECPQGGRFAPEDEITFHKAKQLRKMAQIYLSSHKLPLDISQQIDILAIELDENNQIANIRHTENAIEDY